MTQAPSRAKSRIKKWTSIGAGVPALVLVLLSVVPTLGGCATGGYYAHRDRAKAPSDARIPAEPAPPRSLAMFEGDTGRVATWADLMDGIAWADVIFVGELHDHRAAHIVELAIIEDTLASTPGAAVSLEMFERDDQPVVDKYLRGEIDVATLVADTKSKGWGPKNPAKGSWEEFYQPLVDAAKAQGSPVIAANAPRKYVRMARSDGYEALAALPADERALFDMPRYLDTGRYRKRFEAVMVDNGADPAAEDHASRMDSGFRSQQVWDATMGRSIAKALDAGAPKVVHCVGSFHSDWQGGTVMQLRDVKPRARVLTVSVVAEAAEALRESDRGRADIVIYAARGPNEGEDDEETTEPAPTSSDPAAAPATGPEGSPAPTPAPEAPTNPHKNPHANPHKQQPAEAPKP